jgi:peptidyl-prolyl cis-trans isomerase B (cyclophilin B)
VTESTSGCEQADRPDPKPNGGQKAPSERLDPEQTHRVVVETNCGTFTITLAAETSPATTSSFASLAKAGFFDDTIFHRIVPGFVIQGGDPTATGGGGPGYSTRDRPPPGTRYVKGVVAMAKTETDPPGTSGSQFFVVTGDASNLAPDYALLGEITDGMDVVDRIGKLGNAAQEPTETIVIRKMTVESS